MLNKSRNIMEVLMEEKCHICGANTEFFCCDCDQPVCEDCCVVPTYMNQIDYTICTECGDAREAEAAKDQMREWKIEAEIKTKKEIRAAARRANYWKPENVAKRKAKRDALLLARKEAEKARIEKAIKIVGSMFRGMF